jgi:hypothetical protein
MVRERSDHFRRLKGSTDSVHYLERDELAGLKRLQREREPKAAYVFVNERGQPFGRMSIARIDAILALLHLNLTRPAHESTPRETL